MSYELAFDHETKHGHNDENSYVSVLLIWTQLQQEPLALFHPMLQSRTF